MGLGRYPDVSLSEAREEAEKWRAVVRQGKDAIKERERQRRDAERNMNFLSVIARDAFESRKAELKGDGKAGRWFSPLELHVLPKLGKMPVSEIDQRDIRDTLAPIWHEKADTARKEAYWLCLNETSTEQNLIPGHLRTTTELYGQTAKLCSNSGQVI